MGEKMRPGQPARRRTKFLGSLPPLRAVLDEAQHEECSRQLQKHLTRYTEHQERISDDDARELVRLYFALDRMWKDPEIAHSYRISWLAGLRLDQDDAPRDERVERAVEQSRTSLLHWDVLAWTFGRTQGKRPLGQALHRWVSDVIHGKRLRPKDGKGTPGPASKMADRDAVLCWAVHMLKACGMSATINEATDEQQSPSACHIVAELLAERDHPVKAYNTMRGIWRRRQIREISVAPFPGPWA